MTGGDTLIQKSILCGPAQSVISLHIARCKRIVTRLALLVPAGHLRLLALGPESVALCEEGVPRDELEESYDATVHPKRVIQPL